MNVRVDCWLQRKRPGLAAILQVSQFLRDYGRLPQPTVNGAGDRGICALNGKRTKMSAISRSRLTHEATLQRGAEAPPYRINPGISWSWKCSMFRAERQPLNYIVQASA